MVSAAPLATRVSMQNMEVVDEVCRSTVGCGGLGLPTITLIAVTATLALAVFATLVHVWDAELLLDEERRRLAAERDAFAAFSKQVADMEVSDASATVPASGGLVTATTASDGQLDRVRDAYRETVMAVDHFNEDYGETLEENLTAEFGESLALAVEDGDAFTPQLKAALLESSQEASRQRASFISTLDDEADALSEAAADLADIEAERASLAEPPLPSRSYETLVGDWHRVGGLRDRSRSLATERQQQLQELSASLPPGREALAEYLYEELSVAYPVLADATSLSEAIEELQSRILRSLTRRV